MLVRMLLLACLVVTGVSCGQVTEEADLGTTPDDGKADGLFSKDPVDFWCQTSDWISYESPEFGESYDRAFLTTVACETVERWTLAGSLEAAAEACASWGARLGIDAAMIETVTYSGDEREDCHGNWQDFDRATFGELRINRVHRMSEELTEVGYTLLYVDNRGDEEPIALSDGQEQPQWVEVGNDTFCGFPGADIGFHEVLGDEPSTLTVRHLSSGREAIYRMMDVSNFEFRTDAFELVSEVDGDDEFAELTATPFLTRSWDMGGNFIEFRPALTDSPSASFDISYFTMADEPLCSP